MAKIDRDAAIAVIFWRYKEAAGRWNAKGSDADYGAMVELDRAGNELAKLPAEEDRPAFRWVPLSERKPDLEQDVLVSTRDGEVLTAWRYDAANGCWFLGTGDANAYDWDVLAWAPLPEPYKEESDG